VQFQQDDLYILFHIRLYGIDLKEIVIDENTLISREFHDGPDARPPGAQHMQPRS
jgi:hypothetical protein